MVWKNRVYFSLFCLLQRYAGWIMAFCNPTYCGQKCWVEPAHPWLPAQYRGVDDENNC